MKRLLALLSAAVLGLSACGGGSDDYAVKINEQTISSEVILDELHTITSNPRYVTLLNQQLGAGADGGPGLQPNGDNTVNASYTAQLVFNRVIVALIDQEVKKQNLSVTPEQMKSAEQTVREDLSDDALFDSLPNSYRSYLIDRLAKLNAIVADRGSVEKLRAYYEANRENYAQYCVRHILVESLPEAEQLRKQIVDDGGDFAAVARGKSLDNQSAESSASQGGALGCFSKEQMGQFVSEFGKAALELPVKQVSQPVKTDFGYHLIEVTSKDVQAFEQVQQEINQQLASVDTFLVEALKNSKIKVNPRFGTYQEADPANNKNPTILPPATNAVTPKSTTTTIDPLLMQQYQQQLSPEQLQQLQQQQLQQQQ